MAVAAMVQTGASAWRDAQACIETLAGCLEAGLLILNSADGQVLSCNDAMGGILGVDRATLEGMSGGDLLDLVASLVPDPPPLVRGRALLAINEQTVCEEFEIPGPPRSVVRWVSHGVAKPEPAIVVVVTDITAEVDLAAIHERDATTDRLTDVLNRRGIEPQLAREMSLASRHGTALSALLIDVDHFKHVNDQHGHNVGDDVLRSVARVISRTLRATDIVGRWGGEEFLVLLPHTDLKQAHLAGERIRRAVESGLQAEGRAVTISGGVAQLQCTDSGLALVDRADKQLYLAKSAGRNRIC